MGGEAMSTAAVCLSIFTFASWILWVMDPWILWVVGFIGFMWLVPPMISSWIALASSKMREAKGKPAGNIFVIYSVVTGLFLAGDIVYAIINFVINGPNSNFGYGFLMMFFVSPIMFAEFIAMMIAAISKSKKPQNNAPYGRYAYPVNAQYNNMYQGYPGGAYPNYQNYPNANYPYQNYPYPSGNYPNYPNNPYPNGNYPDGNYPNYNNATNGYDPNYPNNNFGGR